MGDRVAVSPEGVAAWSNSAEGVATQIAAAEQTARSGPPPNALASVFGSAGAGFVAALNTLVQQHVGTIESLAAAVRDASSAGALSAQSYAEHDAEHADSIARAGRHQEDLAGRTAPASVALRGFDTGLSSAEHAGPHHHSEGFSDNGFSDDGYPIGGYPARRGHGGGYQGAPYRDGYRMRDAALQVRIPGHGAVQAPNPRAARAVRTALDQIGTPYVWGGTTPGVGLDCSGLTQYAYRQAGIELPRLAQDQGIGARVAPGDLQPGDLAVWSGHVAMVVGNGQMVEAQQPGLDAALDPIRTDNAGDAFLGFFRPTASEDI
jgi:hypothetical protein